MAKIRIIYGSETGNTKSIAEELSRLLSAKGHAVQCESAGDTAPQGIGIGFDIVLLGTSVWGTDEIELQSDFEAFAEDFSIMGFKGVKCAAFASGDISFEHFCGGVDFIEEHLQSAGAVLAAEGLRLEGNAAGNKGEIAAWVENLVQNL